MAKIKITENELKQIIRESVASILKESVNDAYTLNQLVGKDIMGGQYNGDPYALAKYVMQAYQQLCKEKGINAKPLTSSTRVSGKQWVEILNKAKGMDRTGTLAKTFDTMIQGITAKSSAQGVQDAVNNGAQLTPANPYSTGPGDQNVAPNAGKPFTFTQLTQTLGNKRGTTMSFQQALHDSVGPWNGQDEKTVRNTIVKQIRSAKPTLAQSNPQNAQKAEQILNQWLQGGIPYRTNDVHWAMNVFDQAAKSSRNDMPIVAGFQKALNAFGMKDAQGKPFAVDGILGNNTSAALKQAGYQNIFDFKNDVVNFQKTVGLKPDGIVGNQTLGAFQRNNIKSIQDLKQFMRVSASMQQNKQNKMAPIAPAAMPGQITQTTPAPQPTIAGPKPGMAQA